MLKVRKFQHLYFKNALKYEKIRMRIRKRVIDKNYNFLKVYIQSIIYISIFCELYIGQWGENSPRSLSHAISNWGFSALSGASPAGPQRHGKMDIFNCWILCPKLVPCKYVTDLLIINKIMYCFILCFRIT